MDNAERMDELVEYIAQGCFRGVLPPFAVEIAQAVAQCVPSVCEDNPEVLQLFLLRLTIAFRQRIETQKSI